MNGDIAPPVACEGMFFESRSEPSRAAVSSFLATATRTSSSGVCGSAGLSWAGLSSVDVSRAELSWDGGFIGVGARHGAAGSHR